MSVEWEDNTMIVKESLTSAVSAFLSEAGGEIQAQAMRNSRVDTGQTRGSYQYKVEEGSTESTVYVGSDNENAIWEEFGTGEYAIQGGGRKTPWVYKDRKGIWHKTHGKTANRPLYNAFNSVRDKLESMLQSKLNQI